MKVSSHFYVLLFVFCLINVGCAQPMYDLAVENVQLFDSKTGQVLPDKTILINADTIAAIIDADDNFKALKTIKGNGRLTTPGFVDTHMHTLQMYEVLNDYAPEELNEDRERLIKRMLKQQFLAYGTTTVVDMGQPQTWIKNTIEWQKNPEHNFPNYYLNGSSLKSTENRRTAQHHRVIRDPEEGRRQVQYSDSVGLKFMKLYSRLREDEMKAVIDEASKTDIILNAHVDNNVVTIQEAMDWGVRNFEHFFTVIPSVIAYNEHWAKCDEKYHLKGIESIDDWSAQMVFFFDYVNELPEAKKKLDDLFDRMARDNATLSTALHVLATTATQTDFFTSFNSYPLRFEPNLNQYNAEKRNQLDAAYQTMIATMKSAHDRGVKLRIGTDCRFGGRSLISELKLMALGGFSIGDVLKIATWNGAEAMGLTDKVGSIEVGKNADLVMFKKDPFNEIVNFGSDKVIIKGGKEINFSTSVAYTFEDKVLLDGWDSAQDWLSKNKMAEGYDYQIDEMYQVAYDLMASNHRMKALELVQHNLDQDPASTKYLLEELINGHGYALLQDERLEEASTYFQFNADNFPNSWNAYDSLGEINMKMGRKEDAIKYYEKSLELNPENQYGIDALKTLKG